MKIGVVGLWHLGVMYAVGFAELGHDVTAYDPNAESIAKFKNGKLLVSEPQLSEMLVENMESERLKFTSDASDLKHVDLIVLAYDTPVDEEDNGDANFVIFEFEKIVEHLKSGVHILVSSQLPVGSSDRIVEILSKSGHKGNVVVQPENLRLGKAVDSFFRPDRIVAGTSNGKPDQIVIEAFKGIDAPIIWMHRSSAEVTKHALNAFLATSVTFMGELAEICELVGADAKEVEIGLKSDPRIGAKAYLSPGLGFAGGTLARDVRKLSNLQSGIRAEPAIFTSLLISNRHNNDWVSRSLSEIPLQVDGLRICFWGVSYTENTDTLRRSEIYQLMKKLSSDSAVVSYVENMPINDEMDSGILCIENLEESLRQIDVLVVSKKLVSLSRNMEILKSLQDGNLWILDPSRILLNLSSSFVDSPKYLTVGKGI
jgi:UDPglucose 6-dehydrogenase